MRFHFSWRFDREEELTEVNGISYRLRLRHGRTRLRRGRFCSGSSPVEIGLLRVSDFKDAGGESLSQREGVGEGLQIVPEADECVSHGDIGMSNGKLCSIWLKIADLHACWSGFRIVPVLVLLKPADNSTDVTGCWKKKSLSGKVYCE